MNYPLPNVYTKHACFDDGKISESRKYDVLVTNIISFENANKYLSLLWEANTSERESIFEKTDYFIEGVSYEEAEPKICYFAKKKNGGWFGLGRLEQDINGKLYSDSLFCSGLLDTDDRLVKTLKI